MVNPGRRWNVLRALARIRHGPGAALLPLNLSRMHLEFSAVSKDGHVGAKKFWQKYLPSLKFYNPSIPMVVNRIPDTAGAATLSLYFRKQQEERDGSVPHVVHVQPSSSSHNASKAQPPAADEDVIRLDVKGKHETEIFELVLAQMQVELVHPTEEEAKELEELARLKAQGAVMRQKTLEQLAEQKQEEARLERARKAAGLS